ncbi:methyltransferase domain-containing protein [Candidatus Micrarchaeota archaeon]|nr:methyltransferase domain-containing protein [Candidatus Micrarchaeota archaeon]
MKYYDEFAELYDELSMGLEGELEFYLKEAKKAEGPVLEAGCGTGRILLPLLEAGIDAEGIDNSPGMLDILKSKAREKGIRPRVRKSDMRNFRSKKKYGLIIVPYRAFLHVEKSEEQIRTLKNFKKHLRKRGRLILNFFYPDFDFMSRWNGKTTKQRKVKIKGKKHFLSEKTLYYPVEQLFRSIWTMRDSDGKTKKMLKMRACYIYKKEFELLLRIAGFRKWRVYGGFEKKKLKNKEQEMVWIIES